MFEAYKVGVTLALNNKVSSVLGLIGRDFMKTNVEAKALQATLKEIKLLGLTGGLLMGGGLLGIHAMKGILDPAMEYAHQLNIMNMAGMKQAEIADAVTAAWKNTKDVMTSTPTGNLKAMLDLRNILGDMNEAKVMLPITTKIQAVMAASSEKKISQNADDIAFSMAKALDMIGAVRDPVELEKQAGMMSKVVTAFQGRVTPQMYQSVFQYARQAKFDMSDEFKYEILPSLMLEAATKNGGGGGSRGVGPMMASMYRLTNQGYINKKSLPEFIKLGLLAPGTALKTTTTGTTAGALKGADLAASNSFRWVNEVLVPAIKAKYGENLKDADIRRKINELFRGNQLAASLAVEEYTKAKNFLRDQKIIRGAMDYKTAFAAAERNDPYTVTKEVSAQWEMLKTALGVGLVPILLPFLRGLRTAIDSVGTFLYAHPRLATMIATTLGALAVAATIGGGVLLFTAAMRGLGLLFGGVGLFGIVGRLLPSLSMLARIMKFDLGAGIVGLVKSLPSAATLLGSVATAMGTLAIALGVLGGAVAAFLLITYHKEVADWADKKAPWLSDALMNTRDFLKGGLPAVNAKTGNFGAGNAPAPGNAAVAPPGGYAPPARDTNIKLDSTINIDGRQVAKSVSDYFYDGMNRNPSSGGAFDGGYSYVPSSYTPVTP